jgi:hypothetical protein
MSAMSAQPGYFAVGSTGLFCDHAGEPVETAHTLTMAAARFLNMPSSLKKMSGRKFNRPIVATLQRRN